MSKKEIRIFELKYTDDEIGSFQHMVTDIMNRGFLTNDVYVKRFESALAGWLGDERAIGVSSGTMALEAAFRAIGIQGKKVVLPSVTFIATFQAILNAGGIPIIVDIELDYFGICPQALEDVLKEHSNIAAICHVHIGSHVSSHFTNIIRLADNHDIPLIEDACHVFGATLGGKKAGTFGRYGCFSFFTTKIITTGEGGAIICGQGDTDLVRSVRQFGMSTDPLLYDKPGNNMKMNEFSAALGLLELSRVEERIQKRRQLASHYQNLLVDTHFRALSDSPMSKGSYYKQILISNRFTWQQIRDHLRSSGISLTGGVYHYPLHRQPAAQRWVSADTYPNSDFFADHHFCPPCYPELSFDDIEMICHVLKTLESSTL